MAALSFTPSFPVSPAGPLKGFSPPVHRFPFGSHAILFKKAEAGVIIVRVFHARMDWLRLRTDK